MRLLFVKHTLAWPRSSGHDVHAYYMMRACAELGHEVGLITVLAATSEALAGLDLSFSASLSEEGRPQQRGDGVHFSPLQERFRSYWGVDRRHVTNLGWHVQHNRPDAVIAIGLDALAYLAAVPPPVLRVWYAADEWVFHHLSLIRGRPQSALVNLRAAAIKGLYERVYAPLIDCAWVVSSAEERAMRVFAGVRRVDVVANGVDADYFHPVDEPQFPASAVFWGRLDFEPNIQGLSWFCRAIWPELRRQTPDARFTIIGYRPGAQVLALGGLPGVEVKPDLADIRGEVSRHRVVVLPFISGGGIKNKLLEAAAMGKPIVCTRRTVSGLRQPADAGLVAVDSVREWVATVLGWWSSAEQARQAGAAARAWVVARHSWTAAADAAAQGLAEMRQERAPQ